MSRTYNRSTHTQKKLLDKRITKRLWCHTQKQVCFDAQLLLVMAVVTWATARRESGVCGSKDIE